MTGVRLAMAVVICAAAPRLAVRDHVSAGRCCKPGSQALHGTFLRSLTERYVQNVRIIIIEIGEVE